MPTTRSTPAVHRLRPIRTSDDDARHATGLQQKDQRWYSPDLGRFVSEDPIQAGSNWYAFAGNDPVNYADPSGLSQQGHPLNGGYSGNRTTAPLIKPGNIPANNLFGGATQSAVAAE